MKNIFNLGTKLVLMVFLCFTFTNANAQITGGGNKSSSPKVKKEKRLFDNYWNMSLQTAGAMGRFGTAPTSDFTAFSDINDGQVGNGFGMGVNIGQTFYLNSLDLSTIGLDENFRVGVEATYLSFIGHFYKSNFIGDSYLETGSFFLSSKVGPSISYNVTGNLILGAKLTLEPTIYGIDMYYEDRNYNNTYIDKTTFLMRSAIGFYARMRPFLLGFDLSFGGKDMSVNYGGYDYIDLKTSRFDLHFGVSF